MLKKLIVAYYRRFPTPQMIDDLQVDYIHYPHGIDHTNHKLPHSHLWDQIEWETIPFTDLERRMYIRLMDEEHLKTLLSRGKAVRFHIHGLQGGSVTQECAHLHETYCSLLRKCADGLFKVALGFTAVGVALITISLT